MDVDDNQTGHGMPDKWISQVVAWSDFDTHLEHESLKMAAWSPLVFIYLALGC